MPRIPRSPLATTLATMTAACAMAAAAFASPDASVASVAKTVETPGVTAPLTAAQIARAYPKDALSGAAVDEPRLLKSRGGMSIRVVKIADGLSHPDGLVFLPNEGTMLITERPGRLRRVKDGVLDPRPIAGLPKINNVGLGGLHDIVLHPEFKKNRLLYISYTKDREPEKGTTLAILRARLSEGRLQDTEDILITDAWESPLGTYGGRMVFGPDGMLYISVGDRDGTTSSDQSSARPEAQNLRNHIGSILRVRDDGTVPRDNPFVGSPDAKAEIYSYGHRNVYGMDWDPSTGEMWASEFGPAGGDEINRIIPGHNYGWPLVSLGRHYSGSPVSDQPWYREGMDNPLFFWNPPFNPENMFFYTGDKFPRLKGSLMVAGAGSKKIAQMSIRGDFIKQGDTMLNELDVRFRDIRQGPDGYIYVLTEGRLRGPRDTDGMLLRLEPPSAEAAMAAAAAATLPEGKGKQQLERACGNCHGVDMVLATKRPADEWQAVMNSMIGKGMKLTDSDYEQILAYLSEHWSNP
ncbi:PQQ-dependent sugar dehydrogenase [Congregibacter litoralis]|uniref:Glucose/sorbosone dehydrogenase n=1 Tax=Congregibacter litoralis KT71 TaxID=314285 RepID=A4A714_9GAMM|nr:PQQ-dependent sugar dehydrogenase [Congregibacter litoralis]EAQ98083.2 Glucose/sorbosone dehydrogenase [Congregibacter litoralis KT71]